MIITSESPRSSFFSDQFPPKVRRLVLYSFHIEERFVGVVFKLVGASAVEGRVGAIFVDEKCNALVELVGRNFIKVKKVEAHFEIVFHSCVHHEQDCILVQPFCKELFILFAFWNPSKNQYSLFWEKMSKKFVFSFHFQEGKEDLTTCDLINCNMCLSITFLSVEE